MAHPLPQRQNKLFITEDLTDTGIKGNILEDLNIFRQ